MTNEPSRGVHTCGLTAETDQGSQPGAGPAAPPSETNPARTLPKMLRGSIHVQWVKCGKPGCHCVRGELHGPYYYLFQRINGRLHKTYVSREQLPVVAAAVGGYKDFRRKYITSWPRFRSMRDVVRFAEALAAGPGVNRDEEETEPDSGNC